MKTSGKFVLRISPEMHALLKCEAEENNLSLNQLINKKLFENKSEKYESILKLFKHNLLGIVLFGSYVRGEPRKSSDIDLLIVLAKEIEIKRSLYHLWDDKIEHKMGSIYSPQFTHLPKDYNSISSLWLEVGLEGEIAYDPLGVIKKEIFKIKSEISSGKYRRKLTHGHPYWIKKESYE